VTTPGSERAATGDGHAHDGHSHHGHSHHHDELREGSPGRLVGVLGANLVFTVAQVAGGVVAGSLALLADAAHNAIDVVGLAMAAIAVMLARRPAGPRHTYGLRRAEALAAQVSALLLLGSLGWVGYEALVRLFRGGAADVDGSLVAVLALAGLAVNGAGALVLHVGAAGRAAMATRAALLHLLADAATSAAVLVAGLAIAATGADWIDPAVSLAVAVVVAVAALRLLQESSSILLDASPSSVDTHEVAAAMEAVEGVAAVHHLHVWSLAEREVAVSAHVVVDGPTTLHDTEETLATLQTLLADRFGIAHPTLQLECHPCADQDH
jgi:cobalt-zinc-cadmium efflux system protein